jgi:hypothetical protein
MLTATIINDLHELSNEIQSLLNELNEVIEEQEIAEDFTF